MTQNEIIEMAKQAGMDYMEYISEDSMKKVEAFAKLVAAKHDPKIAIADAYRAGVDSGIAAEREACAKVCEQVKGEMYSVNGCIAAIRARGEGQAFPTASHYLQQKQGHDGQAEFQRFVKSELGDIAVLDDDKFVSEKIKTYWRVWCASRGVKS
jgi:hypothetical protein